jgi:hypothetical protein
MRRGDTVPARTPQRLLERSAVTIGARSAPKERYRTVGSISTA